MDFEGFDGSDCLLCLMKKQFLGYFLCSYLLFGFVFPSMYGFDFIPQNT